MLKLYVLGNNERLNLDKSKETFTEIAIKLDEEYTELIEALLNKDQEHIAEEALDVLQVVIGILDKLNIKKSDLEKEVAMHNAKLKGRGWDFKKVLEVREI